MNALSTVAWAVVLLVGGAWLWFRIERWWAERRVRQLHWEVIEIGRRAGFADSELETYCDGCGRFSLGPVCPYCLGE